MKNHPLIRLLSSPKLTVVCLLLLIMVVIWGTVYQVENGLYQAQQKFFYSWFFPAFGFFPIPGTVLIFWVLFINVCFSLAFRIPFRLSNLGNILIHAGIVIFFVGGFFTYYYSQESIISLGEGQEKNYSVSGQEWELAVWKIQNGRRVVNALDARRLRSGEQFEFPRLGVTIKVNRYYPNCVAFKKDDSTQHSDICNVSGIGKLEPRPEKKEPSENVAGIVFSLLPDGTAAKQILLFGAENRPTDMSVAGETVYFSLRKKRFWLPFSLKLLDFKRTFHPGSDIAKSYESLVRISIKNILDREVVISMNKPLRYRNFTLYQSSYFIGQDGREFTVLAVVRNFGKLFPYISSLIIFLGLCLHFILMLLRKRKTREKVSGDE